MNNIHRWWKITFFLVFIIMFSRLFTSTQSFISPFHKNLGYFRGRTSFTSNRNVHMSSNPRRRESMGNSVRDTVYALSSGSSSVSGVAVVRISGPLAGTSLQYLTSKDLSQLSPLPKPRMAALKSLYCPKTRDMLDKALVLWFDGPKSFTGEDVVELHLHGSRAVLSSVFAALAAIADMVGKGVIRAAERGEFTRRAFENGKMDLTEVEGLSDLLHAETSEQRKQALRQMEGTLKVKYDEWRNTLMKCLAHTEAVIDFGDDDREDDINDNAMQPLFPLVRNMRNELSHHLDDNNRGEIIREGVQIALVGQPNAGKSSLMNALARRPAAIVSPIAGTTRDIVEVRMDIDGISCIVRDTAGLRSDTADPIEKEGIRRAREALEQAQIRIFVVDMSSKDTVKTALQLYQENVAVSHTVRSDEESDTASEGSFRKLLVCNKVDLIDKNSESSNNSIIDTVKSATGLQPFFTSCVQGEGLSALEEGIKKEIDILLQHSSSSSSSASLPLSESVMITRERHRGHVKRCIDHLDRFLTGYLPMDAAAEELRLAMMEMGKVTGRVDVEELLDIIFRDFCIGK